MSAVPPRRPTRRLVIILALGMLISGTSTSLWMKFQDNQCVSNCGDPDPARRKSFEQPVLQSLCMMLGETLCLFASIFFSSRFNPYRPAKLIAAGPPVHSDAPPFLEDDAEEGETPLKWTTALLFAGPATFDILGTTSMNAALLWVPVSVYQMLKGALTLWVAFFSILFLGRRLVKAQWLAVATVALGVTVVGYSNLSSGKGLVSEGHPVLGVFIILLAQVFSENYLLIVLRPTVATQFVVEEKVMEHYSVEPLVAVGWEGIFGGVIIGVGMIALHLLVGRTPAGRGGFFDAPNAFHELLSTPKVWGPAILFTLSVAGTNGFGLAVTSNVSATARSTIDTCRTVSIWIVSLALGWETLKPLQLVGFLLLLWGTLVFNGITTWPMWTGFHDESILADKAPGSRSHSRAPSVDSRRSARRRAGSASRGEEAPLLA